MRAAPVASRAVLSAQLCRLVRCQHLHFCRRCSRVLSESNLCATDEELQKTPQNAWHDRLGPVNATLRRRALRGTPAQLGTAQDHQSIEAARRHRRTMRRALAAALAVTARSALDPLLPAASPWTLSTRRRWTLSRATRRLVFEESGACWFDDDANEEGTWEVRGDAVSFTTDCSQNVTRHYHCLLHRNHGLSGTSGRPRLVRGVTARDRVGGRARLFRPVLGAFSADADDYDRRGEAYEEDDGALLDADGAPPR